MDDLGTKGSVSTSEFVSITQDAESKSKTPTYDAPSKTPVFDISQVPVVFTHLEQHFSFSALLLSIVGYVVIAAFGAMHTLGEYLGYILFLGGILFVYKFEKEKKIWLYLFILIILFLSAIIVFQNWSWIASTYHMINKPFQIDVTKDSGPENLVNDNKAVPGIFPTTTSESLCKWGQPQPILRSAEMI